MFGMEVGAVKILDKFRDSAIPRFRDSEIPSFRDSASPSWRPATGDRSATGDRRWRLQGHYGYGCLHTPNVHLDNFTYLTYSAYITCRSHFDVLSGRYCKESIDLIFRDSEIPMLRDFESRDSESPSRSPVTSDPRPVTGDRRSAIDDRRSVTGNRRSANVDRVSAAGVRACSRGSSLLVRRWFAGFARSVLDEVGGFAAKVCVSCRICMHACMPGCLMQRAFLEYYTLAAKRP